MPYISFILFYPKILYNFDMSETAANIAAAVLEKCATSRWREAIRSGELSSPQAENLKTQMGFEPGRMNEGLMKKWYNIAKEKGYVPVSSYGGGQVGVLGSKRRLDPSSLRAVRRAARGGEGPSVDPSAKTPYTYVPESSDVGKSGKTFWEEMGESRFPGKKKWSKMSPSLRDAMTSWGAGHEGSEMQALGNPKKLRGEFPEWRGTTHASPRVVLDEMRDARMMSPDVQALVKELRSQGSVMGTGELHDLATVVPPHAQTGRGYMPKRLLSKYTRQLSSNPTVSELLIARNPGLNAKLQWLKSLSKRVGHLV